MTGFSHFPLVGAHGRGQSSFQRAASVSPDFLVWFQIKLMKEKCRKTSNLQTIEAKWNLPIDLCPEVRCNTHVLYINLHYMNVILAAVMNLLSSVV
jgi:hypothetical protein